MLQEATLYIQDHARAESAKISQDRRIRTFAWLFEINESAPKTHHRDLQLTPQAVV